MSKFWNYFNEIKKANQLEIGQGNTPLTVQSIDGLDVGIKNEYSNPNKSFKDRGLTYQMSRHLQEGKGRFALSSSGNAAISAAFLAKKYSLELELFLSKTINKEKLDRIKTISHSSKSIQINISAKPRSDLMKYVNANLEVTNLRGSTDPYAVTGYKTIAFEIVEQFPKVDAIFLPCSSGTSALGIAEGFSEINRNVAIHICQTTKTNPIARNFDANYLASKSSLSDAITDKVAHRKKTIINIIQQTKGFGWVISDEELLNAKSFADVWDFELLTYNSLLSLAGLLKSRESNNIYTYPVLLFSGL